MRRVHLAKELAANQEAAGIIREHLTDLFSKHLILSYPTLPAKLRNPRRRRLPLGSFPSGSLFSYTSNLSLAWRNVLSLELIK